MGVHALRRPATNRRGPRGNHESARATPTWPRTPRLSARRPLLESIRPRPVGLVAVLLLGCGGDSTTAPPPARPDPARPTTVAITPTAVRLTALGATEQLTAEVRDQNGNAMAGVAVSWASSTTAVATVSASGLVTADGNGTATITATTGSASGSTTITVVQEVRAIAVTPAADTVVTGDTLRLAAKAVDANGHPLVETEFDWTSSDTLVAVVDDAGLVTGVEAGEADVTATMAGIAGGAALAVVAPVPTTVAVTPDTVALTALGRTAQLTVEVRDQAGRAMEGVPVSWSSADTTVAVVDTAGLVTATGGGSTMIAAAAGEASAAAVVTVAQSAGSVVVSPAADTIDLADTLRLAAEAFDENGYRVEEADFTWSSSDVSVASVEEAGLVTGVAEGTATITAAAGDVSGTSKITVENPDKAALAALYESTGGSSWTSRDGWLSEQPLGRWYGVETDSRGRVIRLRLRANNLSGTLPAKLGDLSELRELDLPSNALAGPIPPKLGSLGNLYRLSFQGNKLLGSIPPDLGRLASLESLDLRRNGLSSKIPPELGDLANLRSLSLSGNRLSGPIPPELGNLANLSLLWLSDNELSGPIPHELGNLANLSLLGLSGNELSGLIPPEFGSLVKLTDLRLGGNDLSGAIPPELGNLTQLSHVDLQNNELSGPIPPELGRLTNLTHLRLDGNELSGAIPPNLGNLAELIHLWLPKNDLNGPLPPDLGRLASLEWLVLSKNGLSGPIPPELGNLAKLSVLWLDENELSGPIPPELGNVPNLSTLNLNDNELSGPIPPELGNLVELGSLFLGINELSGPIPPELGGLASLSHLYLNHNELSGSIPPEFGGLSKLVRLVLAGNAGMSGPLPTSLTNLRSLETFATSGTMLCAPSDEAFLEWLATVPTRRVALCQDDSDAAYLVQAVQSRDFPVALVAGERALLRVFPTASRANQQRLPPVRASFHVDGAVAYVADIPGKPGPIPTDVSEASLAQSTNTVIPAAVIRPGIGMVVEIDPDGTLSPELGVARRIPETGLLPLDVREVPLFDLTVIPFLWSADPDSAILELTAGMAADPEDHELLESTRILLPVQDLRVTAHEPVISSSNSAYSLIAETHVIRALEGGTGYYMGMMSGPVTGGVAGLASSKLVSFSVPAATTIAHELGHNMSLNHPPGCGARSLDRAYPYANGRTGAWGFEFETQSLVPPSAVDLMSYCAGHEWISDYHFNDALGFRQVEEGSPTNGGDPVPVQSILLWGGADADSVPFLEPSFVVDAPEALPARGGAYGLTGRTDDGRVLFSVSFNMPEIADGDGRSGFAFALPVEPSWARDLASITLRGPGGAVTVDGATDRPMTILRDPGNGQVRAVLRHAPSESLGGGEDAADVAALAFQRGLDALFSRGIPDAPEWRR